MALDLIALAFGALVIFIVPVVGAFLDILKGKNLVLSILACVTVGSGVLAMIFL